MKKKTLQYILFYLVGIWGFASIIICAGEDIPGKPMSDAMFYGSKLFGILSFWLCYRTGRWLDKKGLFPKFKEED
jgi:hypothetical protein